MITLTKEWLLKTIAELEEERDATPGAVNEDATMALEAMKLALASLEAEPVFEVEVSGNHWLNAGPVDDSDFSGMHDGVNKLYSAPPVPLSVPAAYEHTEDFSEYHEGWNACRAAMLQGAEPVKTANKLPFEQWLSQQTGTIDVECGCVMTEVFFHWLRVAYEAGNSPVFPDGWVACSERMPEVGDDIIVFSDEIVMSGISYSKKKGFYIQALEYDDDEPVDNVTHWMPLPAAPQQEVK
ncbi:DUF551 domain-containing protein [Escherichia coli]|nr:DUF551 domain-containing protein [Escherichia coli]HAV1880435.1 DUF551 domain-containing protein [Enterobacter hormaechei subsp. steigerwaltii]